MPPSLQPHPETITLKQYEALPEDRRIEIFEGSIYDMSSPSQLHQRLLLKTASLLDSYIEQKSGSGLVIPSPFDDILSKTRLPSSSRTL